MKCGICGKNIEETKYNHCFLDGIQVAICSNECFEDWFWKHQFELDSSKSRRGRIVIVKGSHYVMDNNVPANVKGFKGFAGHNFTIKFNDGRIAECNNLWCQGDIPEKFKDKFKDNATFIQ